ncbi:RagB/SusD family nutrient uptake outer membrane protein [Flavobacterium sp. HTF]|uniref:RagB/SusD family nutrient uptake outer membrane protein n=1 Tax=Flavobacterium sp. HTF TaxID=2170732 RepID=UPI000D5D88D9|nr:RagB/SusD family nutrient uptake outer membrane protein [Flavobacterium sp. HTF]PWB27552.1 RagB/SusD family nutrient uptake outer membrane protein [Flavobacterium sp. HTF]
MKNIYITAIMISLLALTSCQDELTTDPIGSQTLEQANSKPTLTSVESSVTSSYDMLSNRLNQLAEWDWNAGLVFQNDIIIDDVASDDMEKKWSPDGDQPWMDEINNFTFTSTNGGPNGLWKYDYEGIKRTNIALNFLLNPDIESLTGITTQRKNQLTGEAYFLRSYYYFSLVTNFGDVPLILAPIKTYQEAFDKAVRAPKEAVWTQIKTDLEKAKTLLPNSKYSSATDKWRVSKGAVIALLAKTALYNKDWASVTTLVSELETTGFYSLNANYFDNFSVNTEYADNEVIFSYNHVKQADPRKGNGICAPLGWGFFAPSADFLASFEPNDPRKLYTVNTTEQWVNKLLGTTNGGNKGDDDAPNNKVFIRYADVLLWKAEALNQTGNYSGAIDIINQIRARARNTVTTVTVRVQDPASPTDPGKTIPVTTVGPPPPAGTLPDRPNSGDKAVVKAWLISERRAELGFENQRMPDLKRWGIAKEVMKAHGKNFLDKHMLYPIPQSEVDASAGLLTQNPGY